VIYTPNSLIEYDFKNGKGEIDKMNKFVKMILIVVCYTLLVVGGAIAINLITSDKDIVAKLGKVNVTYNDIRPYLEKYEHDAVQAYMRDNSRK
jgi:flagellar basal body-associated protein FliL